MEPTIEAQELHCHNCDRYVQFALNLSVDGNYVLDCPNCGHEHCRVVRNGKITDVRWDQRNGNPIINGNITRITVSSHTGTATMNQTYSYDSTGGWSAQSGNISTWNSGAGWSQ